MKPIWTALAGMALLPALPATAASIQPPETDYPAADDPLTTQVEVESVATKYGLDVDYAFVVLELAKGENVTISDILSREAQEAAAQPLVEFLDKHSDTFDQIWGTRSGHNIQFHVSYAPSAPIHEAEALVPQSLDVEFTEGTYSRDTLRATIDALANAQRAQQYAAEEAKTTTPLNFYQIRNDFANNRLLLITGNPDLAETATVGLGDMITIETGEPGTPVSGCAHNTDQWGGSRLDCDPLRGGVSLVPTSTGAGCTQTLMGVRTSDLTSRVLITAAHCGGNGDGEADDWLGHGGWYYYSSKTTSAYYLNRDGSARWALKGSNPITYQNSIYQAIGNMFNVSVIANGGGGTPGVTNRCVSGMGVDDETGSECGVLSDNYLVFTDGGHTVTGGNCDCNGGPDSGTGLTGGDSGAPVYTTDGNGVKKLNGLALQSNGNYGFANYAAHASDFAFCLSSNCSIFGQGD